MKLFYLFSGYYLSKKLTIVGNIYKYSILISTYRSFLLNLDIIIYLLLAQEGTINKVLNIN